MHSEVMTIADELDRAMQAYRGTGISQAELSRISKVPQPTISRTLNGDSTPETATLMKLAKALGCTLGGHDGTLIDSDYPVGDNIHQLAVEEPQWLPYPLDEILEVARSMERDWQLILLGRALELRDRHARAFLFSLRSHKIFIHVLTRQFVRVYCHLYVETKPSGTVAMQDGSLAPPTA